METGVQQQQAGEKLIRILAFTLVISVMSATMFNIVLPEIGAEFHLSLAQVSWVTSAFLLIYAIGTVTYGKLADTYKLKNLITFGLIFFALGSMIGLAAQDYWMVLLGRMLQAVGAAVIPATASIIPVRYFPPESRGRALGISMTGLAIGAAIGPVVAALVVSVVHWRFLFCMPLFTLFTLPFYRKYLDDDQKRAGKIDWIGGGMLAGTVALLLLAITNKAWFPGAGCLVLFVLFVVRIRSVPEPFIKPDLFRSKGYSLGLSIAFLGTGIGYSLAFLSPQLLFNVNHLAPGMIGFAMVPAAITTAVLGRKGGKLADSKGNPVLFYTASVLLLTCFVLLSSFSGISPLFIAFFLIFGNVGQAFMLIALSNAISRTLPKDQSGVGMGLLAMLNFIAGAVSASVYSKTVDQGADSNWNPANSYPDAFVYSNIYFVLVIMHVIILLLYYFQFGKASKQRRNIL
ncbi:MFS transporter [Paenibacillus prosopidis]|uniref:DHA2 family metal-tetracycline-proton antiporter-like MFS transporter n=1 Tax=Paenibacillus prosopidis TaxID=630520 RepID=A0A368W217_9BACL|nr:MFS transporter [Paenibacillus prosopidis]RCW47865.1 DHA2 family metal-tetracycline-proton antiporter-like MFS transporter [Paenibacillus prosopidis]